jgi:hypothetical protein
VVDAYVPKDQTVFQDIVWANYDIRIKTEGVTPSLAKEIQDYLTTSPLMMDKKSKSGVRSVDITRLIRSMTCEADGVGSELHMQAKLCVSGADYLNPEYLIAALRDRFGLLKPDDVVSEYRILRTHVYQKDGVTEFK